MDFTDYADFVLATEHTEDSENSIIFSHEYLLPKAQGHKFARISEFRIKNLKLFEWSSGIG